MHIILWSILVAVLMAGCQSSEDGDSNGSSSSSDATRVVALGSNENLEVRALESSNLSEENFFGKEYFCTSEQSFTIADDSLSFILAGFGNDQLLFRSLVTPSGVNLLEASDPVAFSLLGIRPTISVGYTGLLIPNRAESVVEAGEWKYRVCSDNGASIDVTLSLRTGSLEARPILPVQPFLTGSRFDLEALRPALEALVDIYEAAGISVSMDTLSIITDDRFSVVSSDFNDPDTQALVGANTPERLSIFFVEDFSDEQNLLGIASGLPGPQGVKDPFNAVLIGLAAHAEGAPGNAGVLDAKLLAETAAHEMGHWLGLHHTTERLGDFFDPISDTPECQAEENATDSSAVLSPLECQNYDAGNLMFWVGSKSLEQTYLSPEQRDVIKRAPIMR